MADEGGPAAWRTWTVAGGIVERGRRLLLVRNVRRGGREDWSPPGGVVDPGETLLEGLTREVAEETGITVQTWSGPLYEVRAEAPELGWSMSCQVHYATRHTGELYVDDPDGIVAEAAFVDPGHCDLLLADCSRWVREPLSTWLRTRWGVEDRRRFRYVVRGSRLDALDVQPAAP